MDAETDDYLTWFFCCFPLDVGGYVVATITAAISTIMISLTTQQLLLWASLPDHVVIWIGKT